MDSHVPPLPVMVLDHSASLSGAELALFRLLTALPEGYQITTLLFEDGPLRVALLESGQAVDVLLLAEGARKTARNDLLGQVRSGGAFAALVVRLAREVRRRRPRVLYANSLKAGVLGLAAATLTRTPLVWHVHDRISPDYLPAPAVAVLRMLIGRARVVVTNSQATSGTLPGTPASVAYPGFAPDQIGPPPAERSPSSPPTIGLIGRISPTKGQWEFIHAAAQIVTSRPDTRFRIVGAPLFGEEDYARQLRAEVARLGLSEHVAFSGFVTDTAAVLDELSVCVHASPVPEPFGQVIVEAMIRGVPVVATDAGGVGEILSDEAAGPLGWLVPAGDEQALARAVLGVLDDPQEAATRASRAWYSARRRFPISDTAEVVTRAWRTAASGGRRRRR